MVNFYNQFYSTANQTDSLSSILPDKGSGPISARRIRRK